MSGRKPRRGAPRYRQAFPLLHPLPDDMREWFRAAGIPEATLEQMWPFPTLPIDHPVAHFLEDPGAALADPGRIPTPQDFADAETFLANAHAASATDRALAADHPVVRLLADPTAVVGAGTDRTQWPTADDLEAGADLLGGVWAAWLAERARQVGGDWTDPRSRQSADLKAVQEWPAPFPIGRDCLEWDCRPFGALRELMPFDGDLHAAAILPQTVNGKPYVWFVLAKRVAVQTFAVNRPVPPGTVARSQCMRLPDQWAYAGTLALTVDGKARARCRATPWVRWLADKTIREGQARKGRWDSDGRVWTPARMVELLLAFREDHGPERPKLRTFLDYVAAQGDFPPHESGKNKWDRLSDEWRISWADLSGWVYPDSKN